MESCDDPGVFYTYENGQLGVSSTSQLSHRSHHRNKDNSTNPVKRLRGSLSKSLPNHDVQQTNCEVHTLKDICIKFVAKNITRVESLVGFPDIVGYEIFEMVNRFGHLENWTSQLTSSALSLFVESYGGMVLESLDLSQFPQVMLEDTLDLIMKFSHLSRLDVSHQRLGDDHELWNWVANLNSLEELKAQNCCLSDRGLRLVTMVPRMYKRGPVGLHTLDLSCNPRLTDDCIRYIVCFRHLIKLSLSGCSITRSGVDCLEKSSLLSRVTAENRQIIRDPVPLDNSGWAADVITRWVQNFNSVLEKQQLQEQQHRNEDLCDRDVFRPKLFYNSKTSRPKAADHQCPSCEPFIVLVAMPANQKDSKCTGDIEDLSNSSNMEGITSVTSQFINLKKAQARKAKKTLQQVTKACTEDNPSVPPSNSDNNDTGSNDTKVNTHETGDRLDTEDSVINKDFITGYAKTVNKDKAKSLWAAMNSMDW